MRSGLTFFGLIVTATMLVGCVIRSYPTIRERVDQQLIGNRGYLKGTPPPLKVDRPTTRKTITIEVELPPYREWAGKEKQIQ